MPTTRDYAAEFKNQKRLEKLARCKTDLWFLATQVLKRGWNPKAGGTDSPFPGKGLTKELHRPLCKWLQARRSNLGVGLWMPRWHHKTELIIAEIIQDILCDPCVTIAYFHDVDDMAELLISEVAHHLQINKDLRALDPVGVDDEGKEYRIFPAVNNKRFKLSDQLTVNRHRFSRFPTLFAKGQGSEIGGFHCNKAYLDDIIGRRTIEDSQLPKVKSWVQNTVMPVVDDAQYRARGTRWDLGAIVEEWIASKDWATIVLPCAVSEERDFIAHPERIDWELDKIKVEGDRKLQFPIYGPLSYRKTQIKKLEFFERNMGADFDSQMMNDPSPPGEKSWDPNTCEHYVTSKEAGGPGFIVILGDPAPAKTGAFDARGERLRGDGSKDKWSLAVVKFRRNRMRQEIILLDLSSSREWDLDAGFREMCRLQRKWSKMGGTPVSHTASEATGQAIALFEDVHRRIARSEGVPHNPIRLTMTYKGKNIQFAALCSRAKNDEFLICNETIPPEELDQFINQVRNWKTVGSGNSLRYDDHANVVSFATDPAFVEFVPQGKVENNPLWEEEEDRGELSRSRYCSI